MDCLIELTSIRHPEKVLEKLIDMRACILTDIQSYYEQEQSSDSSKEVPHLEVNAEVQIEIVRFCMAKLKNWAVEILAQLYYL